SDVQERRAKINDMLEHVAHNHARRAEPFEARAIKKPVDHIDVVGKRRTLQRMRFKNGPGRRSTRGAISGSQRSRATADIDDMVLRVFAQEIRKRRGMACPTL